MPSCCDFEDRVSSAASRVKMSKLTSVLKLILLPVFLGWLIVWIIVPTKSYKYKWSPKINERLNATYFGGQGTNILLLSFPIMFIAVFGCIYLHLKKKKENNSNSSKPHGRLAFWSRPIIVMNPMGIISVTELAFGIMFLALLIWSFANYLYVSYGHLHMHGPDEKVWHAQFRSVWLRLGYVGNICYAFLFFPVTRGSSILPLVGLTSESSIKYHIWLGHISMLLAVLHSVGFFIYWGIMDGMIEAIEWNPTYVPNLPGLVAFIVALPMWATSFPQVRRQMFELFFYAHHLYVIYMFFYLLHIGVAWMAMILPGIFLFLIDRYLRFLQSRKHARLISARLLPSGTFELNFTKSPELQYNPASILFLHAPGISRLQWHPFTVTSCSNLEPDRLSVAIKVGGSWTTKLYKELSSSSMERLEVSVEGPYGSPSAPFLRHEALVFVSGGSGLTPFISIIREIIFQASNRDNKVPSILLICAFKHAVDLTMLDLLLPTTGFPLGLSKQRLQIEAYVTQENVPPTTDNQKFIQTKWFKPSPTDAPVSEVLGPQGWIWLCLIISSSFVMFLLLLAFVTRYYIYPIDHNTDRIYNFAVWVLWDILFVCVSVFVVTSVVFLWQKKGLESEGKQIQNVEVPTSTMSPGSWFVGGGEVELESLPHQTLVQATQVYYGGRPNLKKLLLDCKESDTGVLVSGPKGMRHDVANLCASTEAKHLHSEYLSFNW